MENQGEQRKPGEGGEAEQSSGIDYSREAVMQRLKESTQKEQFGPIQIPGWLIFAVLAVIVSGIWYWYSSLDDVKIPVCAVNTASDTPLDIRLDGKLIGKASKMSAEDPKLAVMGKIGEGEHEIEARDSSGKVIRKDKFTMTLNKKTYGFSWKYTSNQGSSYGTEEAFGFLWVPLPDTNSSFYLQTVYYGKDNLPGYDTKLDTSDSLKPFPRLVSFWFQEPPSAVSVPKGWKSTSETALRRAK